MGAKDAAARYAGATVGRMLLCVVLYIGLGILFYRLVEEHCDAETTDRVVLPLSGGSNVTITCSAISMEGAANVSIVTKTTETCTPWTVIDAAYFTVLTFTTIGYGDFSPTKPEGRVFTAVFALFGVTLICAALGVLAGWLLEQLEGDLENLEKEVHHARRGDSQANLVTARSDLSKKRMLEKRKEVYKWLLCLLLAIVLGAVLFAWKGNGDDSTTWVDHFYAATITAASIGYGDYSFDTQSGRLLCAIHSAIAVGLTSKFVACVFGYVRDLTFSPFLICRRLLSSVHSMCLSPHGQ
eukprot:COSAG01_NODE_978_length_12357_cov_10.838554_14_plen_297_part_00